jgi:glycosyltransferase involved in cell wall biosynthesis
MVRQRYGQMDARVRPERPKGLPGLRSPPGRGTPETDRSATGFGRSVRLQGSGFPSRYRAMMSTGHHPLSFSVIIPTYNSASTIKLALQSIEQQSYPAHEVIVVDDGSVDDTVHTIEQFRLCSTLNIKLIQQPNKGAGAARNAGIEMATGDWLFFLDADDTWKPCRLFNAFEYISSNKGTDFLHGDRDYLYSDGSIRNGIGHLPEKMVMKSFLFSGFPIKTSTVAIKHSLVDAYLIRFYEQTRTCEDYYFFWSAIARCEEVGYLASCDVVIYERQSSLSRASSYRKLLQDQIIVIDVILRSRKNYKYSAAYAAKLQMLRYRSAQELWLCERNSSRSLESMGVLWRHVPLTSFIRVIVSTTLSKSRRR